jgi:hypothetical protein
MPESNYEPEMDSTLGLIYRLNYLWAKVDRDRLSGNFDKWEMSLDSVFVNIMYREEAKIDYEKGNDKVKDVKIEEEDYEKWEKWKDKIAVAKSLVNKAKTISEQRAAKHKLYRVLIGYDIWLRKFEYYLKLYIKETQRSPGSSLFHGAYGDGRKGRQYGR